MWRLLAPLAMEARSAGALASSSSPSFALSTTLEIWAPGAPGTCVHNQACNSRSDKGCCAAAKCLWIGLPSDVAAIMEIHPSGRDWLERGPIQRHADAVDIEMSHCKQCRLNERNIVDTLELWSCHDQQSHLTSMHLIQRFHSPEHGKGIPVHTFCCCRSVRRRLPPASREAEGARDCSAARRRTNWRLGGRSLAGRSAGSTACPEPGRSSGRRGLAGILKADTRCRTIAVMALRASTSTTTRQSCAVTFSGLHKCAQPLSS